MHFRRTTVSLLFILALGLAPFSFAQIGLSRVPHRTLGYYDPTTGAFEPLHPSVDANALPPVAPTTGTLTFKFNITVKSVVPTNGVVDCSADASTSDSTSDFAVTEHATGVATHVSGTTYSCTAIIHYSWNLGAAASDKIVMTYEVELDYGYEVTATNGSATLVVPAVQRSNGSSLTSIDVPASGATTTETIPVTL